MLPANENPIANPMLPIPDTKKLEEQRIAMKQLNHVHPTETPAMKIAWYRCNINYYALIEIIFFAIF